MTKTPKPLRRAAQEEYWSSVYTPSWAREVEVGFLDKVEEACSGFYHDVLDGPLIIRDITAGVEAPVAEQLPPGLIHIALQTELT